MFPFDLDDDEIDVEQREEKEPRDYEIDFKTGKLTGKIITGKKAIEQWIIIVLSKIDIFIHNIHGTTDRSLIHYRTKCKAGLCRKRGQKDDRGCAISE